MARRRRGLTEAEHELWRQVAATAVPLRAAPQDPQPAPDPLREPGPPAKPIAPLKPPPVPAAPRRTAPPPDPHAALERAHPHMDSRRFEALRRGRMDPQARLDLHGQTAEHAHASLTGFILSAHAANLRLVLVITGKGRPGTDPWGPQRSGILRHSLPHWLAAPPLVGRVLQVAPAHQRHGGTGAFYVYLRRQR